MSVEQVTWCLRFLLYKFLRTWQHPGEDYTITGRRGQKTLNTRAAFSACAMSSHRSLPTTWSVSGISCRRRKWFKVTVFVDGRPGFPVGCRSPGRPHFTLPLLLCSVPSTGPGRKALSPVPGLGLAGGPASAPGGSADGERSGVAAGSPAGDPLPGKGGGRHTGVRAAGAVYKKPPAAPSWDCSHGPALFLVKCY